jgi:site-specific recombinase XerD
VQQIGSNVDVAEIDRSHIREYVRLLLDECRLKETTVKRRLATLKVLFRWLEREEFLQITVFHRLDLTIRIPKRLPRALTASEMRLLLQGAASRKRCRGRRPRYDAFLLHFVLVTLFTTGLRIGEMVSVTLSDIFDRRGIIQVRGKGNRERRVYIPGGQAITVLRQFLEVRGRVRSDAPQLLIDFNGNRMTAHKIRKRLHSLASDQGISRRVTPHMLRHTAATQLLEAGVDIRIVQRLLGHASIATTQIYTHVTDEALRERLTRANTLLRLKKADR